MLVIVLVVSLCIIWWYYNDNKQCAGLPPGPVRHPIVGNLIQVALQREIPTRALFKLSQKYGDLMHIRFGFVDLLVASSAAVKELRSNDELQHEAQMSYVKIRNDNKNVGIVFSNDEVWQTMRRFTIRTLREFGFEKSSMSSVIQEEANKLVELINTRKHDDGTLLNVESLFDLSAVNVLWSMVSGKAFSLDDDRIHELLRLSRNYVKAARHDDIAIAYPFLHDWAPGWSGKTLQVQNLKKVLLYLQQLIDENNIDKRNSEQNCLIGCFLSRIGEPHFTNEQMLYVLLDLFQAGSDTTSNTLAFSILYLVVHQDVQEKVFQELRLNDNNVKEDLPYTNATILECLRYSTVTPIFPIRRVQKDMLIKGYKVPKGMAIMFNLYSVHFDEGLWGDPENFRPERFLRDGVVDKDVAEQLLSFGGGKRECLGKGMAQDTLFGFFTTLCRNFRFEMHKEDNSLNIEPRMGLTVSTYPFRCVVTPRS